MLARGVAVVHEIVEGSTPVGPYPRPKVVRLIKFVYAKWKHERARSYSKRALHERDNWTCAYCNQFGDTVDHVLPRSRGGATSWENTVTACLTCNGKKKARTPEEAGMKLLHPPYDPSSKISR